MNIDVVKKYSIIGFIFSVIAGTLLHFTYEWFGNNRIIGYFSAVNESTWEHLKLLIVPVLLFSILEYFIYGHNYDNFIAAKIMGILLGMATIVSVFYTYKGIIGRSFVPVDILLFVVGVAVCYYYSYIILKNNILSGRDNRMTFTIILVLLFASILIFTYNPPDLGLFREP